MKRNAILFLICGIIVAVLLAGCTAPQGTTPPTTTTPATPAPTTPVVTTAAPSSTLPGTWTLISMLAGTGTSNVLPGTTITAIFAKDGTISGSAGCNKYIASYNSGVNTLTIGALVTTPMTCNSPTGIMNQEQIFLTEPAGDRHFYYHRRFTLDLGYQRKDASHLPERRSCREPLALCRHSMGTRDVQRKCGLHDR